MANSEVTREWWDTRCNQFTLYISQVVLDEAARADAEIATKRLEILSDFLLLEVNRLVRNINLGQKKIVGVFDLSYHHAKSNRLYS